MDFEKYLLTCLAIVAIVISTSALTYNYMMNKVAFEKGYQKEPVLGQSFSQWQKINNK
jgi:hypothetical protein